MLRQRSASNPSQGSLIMTKPELARRLGREIKLQPGPAADQLDRTVNQIVRALRRGEPTRLPGIGTITPGKRWRLREEPVPGDKK